MGECRQRLEGPQGWITPAAANPAVDLQLWPLRERPHSVLVLGSRDRNLEAIHRELRGANVVTPHPSPQLKSSFSLPVRPGGLHAHAWSIGSPELVGPMRPAQHGRRRRGGPATVVAGGAGLSAAVGAP
jgi:hypothetical protein